MNNFKKPQRNRKSTARTGARTQSRPPFRAGGFRRPETAPLFDAICSNCGNKCQVPFRPNGTRPVYCKNCFGAPREALPALKRSSAIRPVGAGATENGGGKSVADLARQIAAMNAKIDTMLRILEDGGSQE
jgi:CxxC-x17-CxxC domain-containing protein